MQRIARSATRALSSARPFPVLRQLPAAAKPLLLPSQSTTTRNFSNPTTNNKMAATAFLDLVKARRTIYALNKDLPISKERIQEIVTEALQHVPSSFNSQSNRVVVLFGDDHDKFWDITSETLKTIVPAENWDATATRISGFKGGAGSILFYEDQTVVEGMQSRFPLYADRFPFWSSQSSGMLQHTLWVALEAEGLGANLQHYNPLVDEKVAETWKLPAAWKLNAQLVFGGKTGGPGEKAFGPVEEKLKVFGA